MNAAAAPRAGLGGAVGPSNPAPPPPRGGPYAAPPPRVVATVERRGSLHDVSIETRALLALGYPFWPLAAVALLDQTRSPAIRRQAMQALGLNFGLFALWSVLVAIAHVPLLGISAWPLIALLIPVWLIATIVYAVQVGSGEEPRVPLISDWLDRQDAEGKNPFTRTAP